MNTSENNRASFTRVWLSIAFLLALALLVLWLLGYGPGNGACKCDGQSSQSESVAVTDTSSESSNVAGTEIANDEAESSLPAYTFDETFAATRVYFDLGSAELSSDQRDGLGAVVEHLLSQPSQVAVLSGFHDPTGDLERNQELAKLRAFAVRDFLIEQGVAAESILLEKPVETLGGGDTFAEARRVEVRPASLQ